MKNYVITIARGFGSGGKEIGNEVAKRLGIPCYEKRILKMASEFSGLNEKMFFDIDEKLRWLLSAQKNERNARLFLLCRIQPVKILCRTNQFISCRLIL